jgi:hypothetical protein
MTMYGQMPTMGNLPQPGMPYGQSTTIPISLHNQAVPVTTAATPGYMYTPMASGSQYTSTVSSSGLMPTPIAPTQTTMSGQLGNLLGPVL